MAQEKTTTDPYQAVAKAKNNVEIFENAKKKAQMKVAGLMESLTPEQRLAVQALLDKEKTYVGQMLFETGIEAVSEIPVVGPAIGETVAAVALQIKALADTKKKYDEALRKLREVQAVAQDPAAALNNAALKQGNAALKQGNAAAAAGGRGRRVPRWKRREDTLRRLRKLTE